MISKLAPARRASAVHRTAVDVVRWRPPGAYALALEVLSISQLRERAPREHFEQLQRVEFYMLVTLTRGHTTHQIDFASIDARPGTWLLLRPGQLQRFDLFSAWQGWSVVFRPELLPAAERRQHSPMQALAALVDALPNVLALPPDVHRLCCAQVRRMRSDAELHAGVDDRNALLLYQLASLLTRLRLHASPRPQGAAPPAIEAERVARLRVLI